MILFPNAKINLGLNVVRKRPDGYHDIDSVFFPVGWKDILEVVPATNKQFHLDSTGLSIPGSTEQNLIYKAWKILNDRFQFGGVRVHLHKMIPMGAGIGGGSADGAFMLRLLNSLFELKLSNEELKTYAAGMGSDCPFFIENHIAFVSGRGEHLEQLNTDLSQYHFLLIYPGLHIGTAEAYAGVVPNENSLSARKIVSETPVSGWKNQLKNDFETPAFAKYPELGEVKEMLYSHGAIYASMTGSGSTIYGMFDSKKEDLIDLFPKNYQCKWC